jgi:hypothetical protein
MRAEAKDEESLKLIVEKLESVYYATLADLNNKVS